MEQIFNTLVPTPIVPEGPDFLMIDQLIAGSV